MNNLSVIFLALTRAVSIVGGMNCPSCREEEGKPWYVIADDQSVMLWLVLALDVMSALLLAQSLGRLL